jgi:hypothetical protein
MHYHIGERIRSRSFVVRRRGYFDVFDRRLSVWIPKREKARGNLFKDLICFLRINNSLAFAA